VGASKAEIDDVEHWLGVFTPILKGFLTEMGQESASLGMQVYGGHGYIRGNGMEQIYRDARISTLYEGTTGVQALDLIGRKVMLNKGKLLNKYLAEIVAEAFAILREHSRLRMYALQLLRGTTYWAAGTYRLMLSATRDRESVSTASYDFMMYGGYVTMAHHWLKMMAVADTKLAKGGSAPREFYEAKLVTGAFYFDNLLPRGEGHRKSMLSGSKHVMKMPNESF